MTKIVSNDFCKHPIYDKWEANRLGIVRHVVNKKKYWLSNKIRLSSNMYKF